MAEIVIQEKDEDEAYDRHVQRDYTVRATRGSADADGPPALSATVAHQLVSRSALHAWYAHPRLNPNYQQEESADFDYGRAAHSLLLEGDTSRLVVIEAEDWRKKDAKEARDRARSEGKTPLLARQMAKVRAMVSAAEEFVAASELPDLLADGDAEHPLHWQEGQTHCRARLDKITADRLRVMDYKSTESANPSSFIGKAVAYGYAMQEAFYRRGVKAVYGREPQFVFLLQEKEPPFACSIVAFDPALQEIGDRQAEYALALWGTSMATGKWPGYPRRVAYLEPPAWLAARTEALDDILELGGQG